MKQKTLKLKETNIFTIRVENFSTPFLINYRIKQKEKYRRLELHKEPT